MRAWTLILCVVAATALKVAQDDQPLTVTEQTAPDAPVADQSQITTEGATAAAPVLAEPTVTAPDTTAPEPVAIAAPEQVLTAPNPVDAPAPEPVATALAPEPVTATAPVDGAPAPIVAQLTAVAPPVVEAPVDDLQNNCPKCKPQVTKACKGKIDGCRNEAECCELDYCNIWAHVGRDAATLLVFYATWCPVSSDFMLPYDLFRSMYQPFSNLLVAKIDADQNPNLVTDFGIDEFPSILFFRRDCYWSASGCYDPMAFRKYNGSSNDFDDVNAWVQQQLVDEHNDLAYKSLPETPDSVTGCKVGKVTQPPIDMREPFKASDIGKPLLPPKLQGALVQTSSHLRGPKSVQAEPVQRPSCRIGV